MKKKEYSLIQLFQVIDERISTGMEDYYSILNHVCDASLFTHELGAANKYLKSKNPKWFQDASAQLNAIKALCHVPERENPEDTKKDQFLWLMGYFKTKDNPVFEVPQLKDEFDTSDYDSFITKNGYGF